MRTVLGIIVLVVLVVMLLNWLRARRVARPTPRHSQPRRVQRGRTRWWRGWLR